MGTPTIIIDTNVLVSALGWKGAPREVIERTLDGEFNLVTCPEQLDELERVLCYPKLALTRAQRARFLVIIRTASSIIEPTVSLAPIAHDPSDTILLELAVTVRADYLTSGDIHLRRIDRIEHTRIVSPRAFLEKR